jgi:hypothetical protein
MLSSTRVNAYSSIVCVLSLTNMLCAHQYHNNAFTEAEVALLPLTVAPAAAEQSTLSQVRCMLLPIAVYTASLQILAVA